MWYLKSDIPVWVICTLESEPLKFRKILISQFYCTVIHSLLDYLLNFYSQWSNASYNEWPQLFSLPCLSTKSCFWSCATGEVLVKCPFLRTDRSHDWLFHGSMFSYFFLPDTRLLSYLYIGPYDYTLYILIDEFTIFWPLSLQSKLSYY